jgi:hypothetical protein
MAGGRGDGGCLECHLRVSLGEAFRCSFAVIFVGSMGLSAVHVRTFTRLRADRLIGLRSIAEGEEVVC